MVYEIFLLNQMINNFFKQLVQNKFILLAIFSLGFFLPLITNAASLSLLPSSSTISVGNIVSIKVSVNTDGIYINNAEANILFPKDILEVISITKSSSIFTLWVEEPSFTNINGKIIFNGGVPTPGFNGQNGLITTITFRAKKEGSASVLFTDGAVRANDGLGTNVLISKNGNVIKIEKSKVEIPKTITVPKTVKKEEIITQLPFDPSVVITGNRNVIKFDDGNVIADVDYYTIQIDGGQNFKIKKSELTNDEYYLPIQKEGSHMLTIIAFSKNGNYAEKVIDFISPPISSPTLSLSHEEITNGESIIIYGKTDYPDKEVNVVLEFEGREINKYSQTTGSDGSFSIITDKIKSVGIISLKAETILGDNTKSLFSEKIYLKVNETEAVKLTLAVIYPLLGLILISILLIILLVSLYAGWHKYFGIKKRINKELEYTIDEVHKAMLLLKEELNNQLETLEKVKVERNLNKKEEAVFNEIKDNIDGIDDFIEKKLKKLM